MDSGYLSDIGLQMDCVPQYELVFRPCIYDAAVIQLISLLAAEAEQGGAMGRLYAEYITHALVMRLHSPESGKHVGSPSRQSQLPGHLLARVLDKMHELDMRPDLKSLAEETGYSRSHFLRMFRATTGSSPHRYLMELRLQRAQELLRTPHASLIEVAASCGFSSHAHMSRMFHRFLGVTPSAYRRTLGLK